MGKFLSFVLFIGGVLVSIVLIWLMNLYVAEGFFSQPVAVIAAALGILLFVLPQWGLGFYLLLKISRADLKTAQQQQQLTQALQTNRQISLDQLAAQCRQSAAELQYNLADMLEKQGWTGYINWKEGVLYSQQTNELVHLTHCPVCNTEIETGHRPHIQCPGCRTEFFLN